MKFGGHEPPEHIVGFGVGNEHQDRGADEAISFFISDHPFLVLIVVCLLIAAAFFVANRHESLRPQESVAVEGVRI